MEVDSAAYALLSFGKRRADWGPLLEEIRGKLPADSRITIRLIGKPVIQEEVNRTSRRDLQKAEWIGAPAAFLIIWLSFGSLIGSLIPLLVGGIGVLTAMGIMERIGTKMDLSVFVLNVIPMVGLALSIDFALIVVNRYREEARQRESSQAIALAMETAGRAVAFSAVCVALGLAGTLYIPMPLFRSVALGALVVLALALLLTLTFVPALLWLLRVSIGAASGSTAASTTRLWYAVAGVVMKRPKSISMIASLVLLSCLLPATRMQMAVPDAGSLPKGDAARDSTERFEHLFAPPGTSEAFVIGQSDGASFQQQELKQAERIVRELEADQAVAAVDSIFSMSGGHDPGRAGVYVNGNRMMIHVILRGVPSSSLAIDWARKWGSRLAGTPFQVGGEPKYQQEVHDGIFNRLPFALLWIAAAQFVVLFLAFRSILLPIKTILMNLLSLAASFGLLVLLFEDGRFGLAAAPIAIMIPVFLFGMTFGISMDYGVFLVSRIAELYRESGDNDYAVCEGLARSGRVITSAAAIMIAVTVPFATAGVAGVRQLGVGIAAAVFLDATIIRMLLVPSLMKLLGSRNWWPTER